MYQSIQTYNKLFLDKWTCVQFNQNDNLILINYKNPIF